jgi:His-Xaa-Ser system protein HxsD
MGDRAADSSGGKSEPLCIGFDRRVYSLETLQKAALKFSRMASFDFRVRSEQDVDVIVTPISALEIDRRQFTALYRNEVLDQHLRGVVARETEAERNLILAYAFSNTKLVVS